MQQSLREILRDNHISGVAVALLLLWSLESGFRALWDPLSGFITFVATAVAIRGIPYSSGTFTYADRVMWTVTCSYLVYAFICFVAAWLLSRWVYGVGPLRSLNRYGARLARRNNA